MPRCCSFLCIRAAGHRSAGRGLAAVVKVFLRDITQITGVLATAMLFLSSAIVPVETLPSKYQFVFMLNPSPSSSMKRDVAFWGASLIGLDWPLIRSVQPSLLSSAMPCSRKPVGVCRCPLNWLRSRPAPSSSSMRPAWASTTCTSARRTGSCRLTGGHRRYYQEFWALRGADLHLARGETVGLIGRNGSGKSTFLQMIAGTLTPTEGSIAVKGRVVALLELGSGFNADFTGRENVYLNAAILGLSSRGG